MVKKFAALAAGSLLLLSGAVNAVAAGFHDLGSFMRRHPDATSYEINEELISNFKPKPLYLSAGRDSKGREVMELDARMPSGTVDYQGNQDGTLERVVDNRNMTPTVYTGESIPPGSESFFKNVSTGDVRSVANEMMSYITKDPSSLSFYDALGTGSGRAIVYGRNGEALALHENGKDSEGHIIYSLSVTEYAFKGRMSNSQFNLKDISSNSILYGPINNLSARIMRQVNEKTNADASAFEKALGLPAAEKAPAGKQ